MSEKRLDDQLPPVRLKAMTLRGVGPYVDGARLEFKPLTILCGTNGSGKSSWVKALNLLRRSQAEGLLPFDVAEANTHRADSESNREPTHSTIALTQYGNECADYWHSAVDQDRYGAPGSIGVELALTDSFSFPDFPDEDLKAGSSVILRMAHPRGGEPGRDRIELLVDGQALLDLQADAPKVAYPAPPVRRYWIAGESVCLISAQLEDNGQLTAAGADQDIIDKVNARVSLIRALVATALDSVFDIAAMRPQFTDWREERRGLQQREAQKRHVGQDGGDTYEVLARFLFTPMRQPKRPHAGYLDFVPMIGESKLLGFLFDFTDHSVDGLIETVFDLSQRATWIETIYDLLPLDIRQQLDSLKAYFHLDGTAPVPEPDSFWPCEWAEETQIVLERVFRVLLELPTLHLLLDDDALPSEARELLAIGVGKLMPSERLRLNRLVLEQVIRALREDHRDPGLDVISYVNAVCQRLLGITTLLAADWTAPDLYPEAFVSTCSPNRTNSAPRSASLETLASNVFPTFNNGFVPDERDGIWDYDCPRSLGLSPVFFSSGCHHLLPLIVQLAVMRRHEILAVDSPEIHLHPKLQLDLTEYFVSQARIGKFILVETHSDLIIRRALRSILEEDMPQKYLQVYFTDIASAQSQGAEGLSTSTLTPIQIDNEGHIANWPKGFMDADIAESRMLMEAMYGRVTKKDDDDLPID